MPEADVPAAGEGFAAVALLLVIAEAEAGAAAELGLGCTVEPAGDGGPAEAPQPARVNATVSARAAILSMTAIMGPPEEPGPDPLG
ncbi:MAG TPA: hypothetical protein VKU60_02135 [Chloroflexota bacterium]|nr:hypothetical protein [Chloroflexota bacterium]